MIKHACSECETRGREITRLQKKILLFCENSCSHAKYAKKHNLRGGPNHICAECPLKEPVAAEEIGRKYIHLVKDDTLPEPPAETQIEIKKELGC